MRSTIHFPSSVVPDRRYGMLMMLLTMLLTVARATSATSAIQTELDRLIFMCASYSLSVFVLCAFGTILSWLPGYMMHYHVHRAGICVPGNASHWQRGGTAVYRAGIMGRYTKAISLCTFHKRSATMSLTT